MSNRAFTLIELLLVCAIIAILASMLVPLLGAIRNQAHLAVCAGNLRQAGLAAHGFAQDNRGATPRISFLENGTYYDWYDTLRPYADAGDKRGSIAAGTAGQESVLWNCPRWQGIRSGSWTSGTSVGMGMNSYPLSPESWVHTNSTGSWGPGFRTIRFDEVTRPAQRLFIADSNDWNSYGSNMTQPGVWVDGSWKIYGQRHAGRTNALFYDLRTETLPIARVPTALYGAYQ